ncbi:MAG: hypothetical protein KF747_10960 [Nitrospira sp.]|nr:hypothetical protein [Nitrospira sp.]
MGIEEFPQVKRRYDSRFATDVACLLPGDFFVSSEPMVVYTVLGSCIAACIRDPIAGVGGMNHFMLPTPRQHHSGDAWGGESTRYGSFAMEQLINEILKRGGMKQRLEIKLFGAGKIYGGNIDVGEWNREWVLRYLDAEGYTLEASDLGDVVPRKVYYFTGSGRVLLKRLQSATTSTVLTRETDYLKRIASESTNPPEQNVTLF